MQYPERDDPCYSVTSSEILWAVHAWPDLGLDSLALGPCGSSPTKDDPSSLSAHSRVKSSFLLPLTASHPPRLFASPYPYSTPASGTQNQQNGTYIEDGAWPTNHSPDAPTGRAAPSHAGWYGPGVGPGARGSRHQRRRLRHCRRRPLHAPAATRDARRPQGPPKRQRSSLWSRPATAPGWRQCAQDKRMSTDEVVAGQDKKQD